MSLETRYAHYRELLVRYGQEHLLRFWDQLDDDQRARLLDDLDQIDIARCARLAEQLVVGRHQLEIPTDLEPADVLPDQPDSSRRELYARAISGGQAAIRDGRVAAFTVAGGQGTRLGYDGPKGAFPITPIRNACLFQVFAEYLLGVQRRYGRLVRWYIMTSPLNHAETLALFDQHDYFGLPRDQVFFFSQGQMPAFLPDGRIAMAARHRIALGPDGHGGSLQALAQSGALADMRQHGIDTISYFQVDNPLVHAVEPKFIGLHLELGSQMSSKAVRKAHDLERVGNFCLAGGKLCVIEYSDIPETLATQKNPDGSRRFDAGSIAIHVLSREFVEHLADPDNPLGLPWHRAEKRLAVIDDDGNVFKPDQPNVVKLELFVFDAIPLARNPIVLYTQRAEEFSPVKNAEGDDSPATARRDQIARAARWLERCGVTVPRRPDGQPDATLEISPARALDADDLRACIDPDLSLAPGATWLLA